MTATCVMRDDHEVLFEGLRDDREPSKGGLLRDAIYLGGVSTNFVFCFARSGTQTGFHLGQKAVGVQHRLSQAFGLSIFSSVLEMVDDGLTRASRIADASLEKVESTLLSYLHAADAILAPHHERGDAVRLLFREKHTKEAMLCVFRLLGKLSLDLRVKYPLKLLSGARTLAQAQELHKADRIQKRNEALRLAYVPHVEKDFVAQWHLYMRYLLASYGHHVL